MSFVIIDTDGKPLRDVAGDPDDEDNADREASDGDDQDQAYVEWQTMRGTAKRRHNLLAGEEDDELGGDETDGNLAEDEDAASHRFMGSGAGYPIADPGGCEHDGQEPDIPMDSRFT